MSHRDPFDAPLFHLPFVEQVLVVFIIGISVKLLTDLLGVLARRGEE